MNGETTRRPGEDTMGLSDVQIHTTRLDLLQTEVLGGVINEYRYAP